MRDALAALYGLDEAAVRVVTPDVGGGFGAKGAPSPEELVLAGLARAVGRPVAWTESRAENLTSSVHGRAQSQQFRFGRHPQPAASPTMSSTSSRTRAPTR